MDEPLYGKQHSESRESGIGTCAWRMSKFLGMMKDDRERLHVLKKREAHDAGAVVHNDANTFHPTIAEYEVDGNIHAQRDHEVEFIPIEAAVGSAHLECDRDTGRDIFFSLINNAMHGDGGIFPVLACKN